MHNLQICTYSRETVDFSENKMAQKPYTRASYRPLSSCLLYTNRLPFIWAPYIWNPWITRTMSVSLSLLDDSLPPPPVYLYLYPARYQICLFIFVDHVFYAGYTIVQFTYTTAVSVIYKWGNRTKPRETHARQLAGIYATERETSMNCMDLNSKPCRLLVQCAAVAREPAWRVNGIRLILIYLGLVLICRLINTV